MSIKRLIVIILAVVLASCRKDPSPPEGYTFYNSKISVTTDDVWGITQTTAYGEGNVIVYGNSAITECGMCWDTNHNPTIENNYIISGSGDGSIFCKMTGLIAGTNYFCRAYAKSIKEVVYGNEKSFTTNPDGEFTITVSADPSDGGIVYGGGHYNNNQTCTLAAIANDGYIFINWKDHGGSVVSIYPNYSFIVNGNRTLVAEFMAKPQPIP